MRGVRRGDDGVLVLDAQGEVRRYDHVVIGAHADEALRMLDDPSAEEAELLGAFRYTPNRAVLHSDESLMPRRRNCWSSWNYVGRRPGGPGDPDQGDLCVSYWMNKLQLLPDHTPLFVTLNPGKEPAEDKIVHAQTYEHPLFDAASIRAQRRLWSLQGKRNTWFCGAYFGVGAYAIGSWLYFDTVRGWASIVGVIALFASAQLLCLGILGEYIGRMFMQAKGRPLAIVREVVVRPTVGAVR